MVEYNCICVNDVQQTFMRQRDGLIASLFVIIEKKAMKMVLCQKENWAEEI